MATKKAISKQERCKEPATPPRIQWPGARRRRGQKRKRAGPSAENPNTLSPPGNLAGAKQTASNLREPVR